MTVWLSTGCTTGCTVALWNGLEINGGADSVEVSVVGADIDGAEMDVCSIADGIGIGFDIGFPNGIGGGICDRRRCPPWSP